MEKCSEGLIFRTAGFHIFHIFIMVSALHIHYLKYFFDMGYFKVFIEFVTILLLFYVLVFWLRGMWGLSSSTKNRPCTLTHWKAKSFNHWITREIPSFSTVSGISMSKTSLVNQLTNNPRLLLGEEMEEGEWEPLLITQHCRPSLLLWAPPCILTFRSTWWFQCRNISRVQQTELAYW